MITITRNLICLGGILTFIVLLCLGHGDGALIAMLIAVAAIWK